ncbi:hypothetical protein C3L33_03758, partial [Rhododendron williamsianum]
MQYPSHHEVADDLFPSILMDFCKALSPLKTREDLILSRVSEHAHLLDLLYHLIIVPRLDGPAEPCNIQYGESEDESSEKNPSLDSSKFSQVFAKLWSMLSKLNVGFISRINTLVKNIVGVSGKFISSVSKSKEDIEPGNEWAYEASIGSESLAFTRYIELMNGIVDTAEDAKLLREKKIIVNSLKSDADVAQLFNGMSKCVRLTNVPFIDKAIEDVNKYFNNTSAVRVYRRMKNIVYDSWQILTILAVVLLMLLMGVQSFCSVYSCPKLFSTLGSE